MWTDDAGDPGLGHVYRLCLSQCSAVPDRCHAHTSPLRPEKRWRITSYCMPTQSKPRRREIHPHSTTARPSKWCHVDVSWWAALAEVHRLLWQWLWWVSDCKTEQILVLGKIKKNILLNLTGFILMNSWCWVFIVVWFHVIITDYWLLSIM